MHPNDIRAELVRRGIRTTDIAKKLGKHREHISQVINGRRWQKDIQEAIAQAIGFPVSKVFARTAGPVGRRVSGR